MVSLVAMLIFFFFSFILVEFGRLCYVCVLFYLCFLQYAGVGFGMTGVCVCVCFLPRSLKTCGGGGGFWSKSWREERGKKGEGGRVGEGGGGHSDHTGPMA